MAVAEWGPFSFCLLTFYCLGEQYNTMSAQFTIVLCKKIPYYWGAFQKAYFERCNERSVFPPFLYLGNPTLVSFLPHCFSPFPLRWRVKIGRPPRRGGGGGILLFAHSPVGMGGKRERERGRQSPSGPIGLATGLGGMADWRQEGREGERGPPNVFSCRRLLRALWCICSAQRISASPCFIKSDVVKIEEMCP